MPDVRRAPHGHDGDTLTCKVATVTNGECESGLAGASEGDLARLFGQAGLTGADTTSLAVVVRHATLDDWWEPFTLGVGPSGAYVVSLAADHRTALRDRCRDLLGPGPFDIRAAAWTVTARC